MIVTIHLQQQGDRDAFQQQAEAALQVLSARPGFLRGSVGRATDDPQAWLLLSEWESVGAYRRALGGYEVKLTATPHEISEADRQGLRDLGFSDEDIFDIAEVAGFFNYTNRVAHAVDMMPNLEYHDLGR